MLASLSAALGTRPALWGLVFLTRFAAAHDYPPFMLAIGRLAFGVLARAGVVRSRGARPPHARRLDRGGQARAGRQPGLLPRWQARSARRRASADPIGTLPVVIAITANLLDRHHGGGEDNAPWIASQHRWRSSSAACSRCIRRARTARRRLRRLPAGHRLRAVRARLLDLVSDPQQPLAAPRGAGLSRTGDRAGLATLPVAIVAGIGYWLWDTRLAPGGPGFAHNRSGRAPAFVGMCILLGLAASWLGTLLWNRASHLLPAALVEPADRVPRRSPRCSTPSCGYGRWPGMAERGDRAADRRVLGGVRNVPAGRCTPAVDRTA